MHQYLVTIIIISILLPLSGLSGFMGTTVMYLRILKAHSNMKLCTCRVVCSARNKSCMCIIIHVDLSLCSGGTAAVYNIYSYMQTCVQEELKPQLLYTVMLICFQNTSLQVHSFDQIHSIHLFISSCTQFHVF